MEEQVGADWFEMHEIRKRRINRAVWIPLRAMEHLEQRGKPGEPGYRDVFYGANSLAVDLEKRKEADSLSWHAAYFGHDNRSSAEDDRYVPCDICETAKDNSIGVFPALCQNLESGDPDEWHLHQDIVFALELRREGDSWARPRDGYIEVARLERNLSGSPRKLSIRAEYLRDYLCARKMALRVVSYHSRQLIVKTKPDFSWSHNPESIEDDLDRWEGRIDETLKGGMTPGSTTAVFHVSRTDVDEGEDVPTFGAPTNENLRTSERIYKNEGDIFYRVWGELWRREWLEPAISSPIVRGDQAPPTVYFITDASGKKENRTTLDDEGRWLWFQPAVVPAMIHQRGGGYKWYTKYTGSVWRVHGYGVPFGINRLSLINVYAKDIAMLPDWQQSIWAGFNVRPEGGVSEELLASQVKAVPANTHAPESFLLPALKAVHASFGHRYQKSLIREQKKIEEIAPSVHRFRAVENNEVLSLAKDLNRLTAESIVVESLHQVVPEAKTRKYQSLKSLQLVVAQFIGDADAYRLMSPLFGIYELRQSDAHLTSDALAQAFETIGIDRETHVLEQATQMLHQCVFVLFRIAHVLETGKLPDE